MTEQATKALMYYVDISEHLQGVVQAFRDDGATVAPIQMMEDAATLVEHLCKLLVSFHMRVEEIDKALDKLHREIKGEL